MAWKVPAWIRRATDTSVRSPARRTISSAARRLNVTSRTRSGLAPSAISRARRATMARVLPVPAPAMTISGPPSWWTARHCSALRPSAQASMVLMTAA